MAILIDFNPLGIASAFSMYKDMPNDFSAPLIRHAIFNQIRKIKTKFQSGYGKDIVIATEGPGSWRKEIFPYYKIKRKEQRNTLPIPWEDVMAVIQNTQEDLREYFPYTTLTVPRTEADDVIAVIAKKKALEGEKVLIVSNDKDFAQLQVYDNVEQYSTYHENLLIDNDPVENRLRKIISGDSGDSVPNIISDVDVFTDPNKRQKPMTKKRLDALMESIEEQYQDAYDRNKKLVDLIEGIPEDVVNSILDMYNAYEPAKGKMYNYFAANGMNYHLENLQDFA